LRRFTSPIILALLASHYAAAAWPMQRPFFWKYQDSRAVLLAARQRTIDIMNSVTDEQFQELVRQAVARIPARFASRLENVTFLVAGEPSRDQLEAGQVLHRGGTLLGLYQGIPLPRRDNGYNLVLPDTITIFKRPHEMMTHSLSELEQAVHTTVWHEVAHYFGLDHGQIHALENK
jgi:predicted Zn-dependent protease with MMP-like domain